MERRGTKQAALCKEGSGGRRRAGEQELVKGAGMKGAEGGDNQTDEGRYVSSALIDQNWGVSTSYSGWQKITIRL